jgi:hypothetical protein
LVKKNINQWLPVRFMLLFTQPFADWIVVIKPSCNNTAICKKLIYFGFAVICD